MLTKKNTLQNKNSKKLSNCISAMAAFAVTSAMAVQAFAATGLSNFECHQEPWYIAKHSVYTTLCSGAWLVNCDNHDW